MMATTYVPIQSVTLASSAASVTFSAIPQTFTDLVVRVSSRSDIETTDISPRLRYNGTSGTVYSVTTLRADSTSNGSYRSSNSSYAELPSTDGDSSTTNTFGSTEICIPNYTASAYKPFSTAGVQENNGNGNARYGAGLFRDTTAISSIEIYLSSYNFMAGSTFHLYGIKNS